MITIKEFLESKKIDSGLSNEELASKSGISVESLREIFKGATASQLILTKIMSAYRIGLYEAKRKFEDFKYTRETVKGLMYYDYMDGEQLAQIESVEIVKNNNRKALRVVLKNKYTYVTTIPIYDKKFDEFEKSFKLDIISTGIKEIVGKIGKINVIDDGSDILIISFRSEENE